MGLKSHRMLPGEASHLGLTRVFAGWEGEVGGAVGRGCGHCTLGPGPDLAMALRDPGRPLSPRHPRSGRG